MDQKQKKTKTKTKQKWTHLEKRRLAGAVRPDKCDAGVHIDAEVEVRVQVVRLLAAVREGDIVECEDGGGELRARGPFEFVDHRILRLGREARFDHFVDNLLLRLGLLDEVGVRTARANEVRETPDIILLLVVLLRVVDALLSLRALHRVVVAAPHDELVKIGLREK